MSVESLTDTFVLRKQNGSGKENVNHGAASDSATVVQRRLKGRSKVQRGIGQSWESHFQNQRNLSRQRILRIHERVPNLSPLVPVTKCWTMGFRIICSLPRHTRPGTLLVEKLPTSKMKAGVAGAASVECPCEAVMNTN